MPQITIQRVTKDDQAVVVFVPATIDITASLDSVFWFNDDTENELHSIALCEWFDDQKFPSGLPAVPLDVARGHSSAQINITTPGKHPYRCTRHMNEAGTINAT